MLLPDSGSDSDGGESVCMPDTNVLWEDVCTVYV